MQRALANIVAVLDCRIRDKSRERYCGPTLNWVRVHMVKEDFDVHVPSFEDRQASTMRTIVAGKSTPMSIPYQHSLTPLPRILTLSLSTHFCFQRMAIDCSTLPASSPTSQVTQTRVPREYRLSVIAPWLHTGRA